MPVKRMAARLVPVSGETAWTASWRLPMADKTWGFAKGEIKLSKHSREKLERVKRFERSTPTLARLCSTPELHPLNPSVRG
jgi:hypothetical protein